MMALKFYEVAMQDSIFREYDIRGKVGSELKLEEVEKLGHAIAYFFYEQNPLTKKVLVGMDARSSSPEIKESLCRALQESGLNVTFIDVCPSPVLYFGLFTLDVDAGLMITASHNPPEYNGIKLALDKKFIWGDQIRYIGSLYEQGKKVSGKSKGTFATHDLISEYITWMVNHFPLLKNKTVSAAIDLGNGTGGTVVPRLAKEFGWENYALFCVEPRGEPERHEADPVIERNMICVKEALVRDAANAAPHHDRMQVGIGLDGDCDRMAAMTHKGMLVFGDRLLSVFAQQVLAQNPGCAIVFDIKASSGLIELIKRWGGKPVMSPSGHAIIKDAMEKSHALLGGELSCHFFFHDRYFGYDDGIYALLRLLEIIISSGKSLDELIAIFPKKISSSEIRLACAEDKKQEIIAQIKKYFSSRKDAQLIMIDGVRAQLPYGWGLVRASNTQPVLSIRFEADNEENLKKIIAEFIQAFGSYYDHQMLLRQFSGSE
jgi:phosphomannomutase/phosphoglucomutase